MSMSPKSLFIAIALTIVAAIPSILLPDLTLELPMLLGAVFVASLIGSLASSGPKHKRSKRKPIEENRTPYNQSRRESGSVKWFNASKGFGFITRDSGDDIFVHFRSIRGEGHRVLHDGQRVEFAISEGDKGLQAEDVAEAH